MARSAVIGAPRSSVKRVMTGGSAVPRRASAWLKTGSGLVVAAIGLLTLAGWLTHHRVLAGIEADFIPMAPNTAISFVLLGIALVAMPGGAARRWHRLMVAGAAGIVALLAGARLAEYASSLELDVDAWFLRVPAERLGLAPVSKMAFFTALTFEL